MERYSALQIVECPNATITDSIFKGNSAGISTMISAIMSTIYIDDTGFEDNLALSGTSNIKVAEMTNLTISNCKF